ncbi:hypothetical protein HMPREF1982_03166 [Clostridiales bacterium oral taxon 876 str. F0540]|nr:hypothetical protein HMPREF1982_03166 [Clostridiales bacterium oral taxon 876 str. F0540]
MYLYKKLGRIIYAVLFALILALTIYEAITRSGYFIWLIFLDVTLLLVGLYLETNLIHYAELGSSYIEISRKTDKYTLEKHNIYGNSSFIYKTNDEFIVKISDEAYTKSYKKDNVVLLENSLIETPIIEITTIKKISQPAHNEYSIFAIINDVHISKAVKIVVNNITSDIEKI